jgi:carbonic anhydrase
MDNYYKRLFDGNRQWVKEKLAADPQYFKKLSLGQSPPALWIGCSDSRVPANEITNTQPGEIFVHRNIANVVDPTDMNLLSVIDFAVKVIKVKHIIVAGHYECSGIKAALSNVHYGLIDNWLRNIKDVYRLHQKELDAITDQTKKESRLVELNVMEGVFSICKTSTVQSAWENNEQLHVHGWVIDIHTGLLKDLNVTVRDASEIQGIYKFDF